MCTRVFRSGNAAAKVVSRTMDWAVSDEPRLWAVPAGTRRATPGLSWRSRFGVVGVSMWGAGTTDAVNSAAWPRTCCSGMQPGASPRRAARAQSLTCCGPSGSSTSTRPWPRPCWPCVRCPSCPFRCAGQELGCHLALEDASGDSAIVEPDGGRLRIHRSSEYQVVANDPPFAEQRANLCRYRPFGGDQPVPGGIESIDRFARPSYFLHYLPEPRDAAEAVAGVVSIAGTVSCPPGAPYEDFGVYPTWWVSAIDLTHPPPTTSGHARARP